MSEGTRGAVEQQREQARRLRALHEPPGLVLPNAWDAGSAALIERAGARAIATTSSGLAWSLGYGDGERLERAELVRALGRIVAAVDLPVSADLEAGYGESPRDVAETVAAVLTTGVAGVNLEDSRPRAAGLFSVDEEVERLRAAREVARDYGVPELVITARCDVYLARIGSEAERLSILRERFTAYGAAGADCLFVPGLLDLEVLRNVTSSVGLPVNVLATPRGPSVHELLGVGVRRVSVGSGLTQVAYAAAIRSAEELLTSGTYATFSPTLTYRELNALFDARDERHREPPGS